MSDFFKFVAILGFGLIAGIRHGIDIDHIAALTDITSSQRSSFLAILYAILYGIGHGIMVIILGILILILGAVLPESVDRIFGKIVGLTLLFLGFYVLFCILKDRKNFRIKSRWMLIFSAIKFGYHKLLHNFKFSHHHPKFREEKYASKTAFGIGLIHGVGAETPTQVSAFLVLLGIGRGVKAISFLLFFVLGIFVSNLMVASLSLFGYRKANKFQDIYIGVGLLTAIFSIFAGLLFLRT